MYRLLTNTLNRNFFANVLINVILRNGYKNIASFEREAPVWALMNRGLTGL